MVLGANNSVPMEMAEVYSTFANKGVHKEPRVISRIERLDQEGNVTIVYRAPTNTNQALTEVEAAKVTAALQQAMADGTGTRAGLPWQAAGKTGTTSDNKDAWFVGYTPKLTTAVWMGFEVPDQVNQECIESANANNTEGPYAEYAGRPEACKPELARMGTVAGGKPVYDWESVTGGSIPAIIWRLYMERATAGSTEVFRELTPDELRSGKSFESTIFQPDDQGDGDGRGDGRGDGDGPGDDDDDDDDGPPNTGPQGPTPTPPSLPQNTTTSIPDTTTTSIPGTTPTSGPPGPGWPPDRGNDGTGTGNG
jgi:membrane peptidoglycan carboxypeptidase